MSPLVSVCIITYNQRQFVHETLHSVLNQDYDNLQIVVADDGSTDGTVDIILDYAKKFPDKIVPLIGGINLGITGNSNRGLNSCTGEYIAFLGGDDLFLPNKISTQVLLMEQDANIIMSYHDVELFNSEDNKIIRFYNSGKKSAFPETGRASKVVKKVIQTGNSFIASSSVIVRRDALPSGYFDERVPVASDWLMWIEVLAGANKNKTIVFIPDVLGRYRRHTGNITTMIGRYSSDLLVILAITEDKYPFLIRSTNIGRGFIRYVLGIRAIFSGDVIRGRYFLWASFLSGYISASICYWILVSYFPIIKKIRERFHNK